MIKSYTYDFKELKDLKQKTLIKVCITGHRFWLEVLENLQQEKLLFCQVINDVSPKYYYGALIFVDYDDVNYIATDADLLQSWNMY